MYFSVNKNMPESSISYYYWYCEFFPCIEAGVSIFTCLFFFLFYWHIVLSPQLYRNIILSGNMETLSQGIKGAFKHFNQDNTLIGVWLIARLCYACKCGL